MAFDDDSAPHLSHPGPSRPEPAPGDAAAVDGAAAAEGPRYRDIGLLGTGGMGEVRAVHDHQLGRQVAKKAPLPGVAGAAEALAREASVTAALEHPGIVPVYDAGHDEEGRPWYTMRLVRGRSLRVVVAETPTQRERLALLRPVLAAIEAVAFAHDRGIVHCDLKTANILLGEHGEVQVVDWGLATAGADRPTGGTPASMAPEQARGKPATRASDVWSLGIILVEVLTGRPPHPNVPGDALRAAVAGGATPPLPDAGVPPALRAIVQRCLRPEPADRYADASALAADLAAFLDGRVVDTHDYSLGDHLRRIVANHRVAVAVGLVATLVLAGISATAARRVLEERDAARAAEQVAEAALARSDKNLARALVLAARTAAAAGRRPEAEVLAAGALALEASPEARGVLAAFGASPRPLRTRQDVPACNGVRRRGPQGSLCLTREGLAVHPDDGPSWSLQVELEEAAFAGDAVIGTLRGNQAVVLDGRTGLERRRIPDLPTAHGTVSGARAAWQVAGRSLVRVDAEGAVALQPCGPDIVAAAAETADGAVVIACATDRLLRLDPDSGDSRPLPFSLWHAQATVAVLSASPADAVAVGTSRGQVTVLDERGERFTVDLGATVSRLWWTADGSRLVVALRQGSPVVLHADTGADLGRLPATLGELVATAGPTGLVFDGDGGQRWELGALRPVVVGSGSGITGIATGSRDDVAVARGDGSLDRYDLGTGARLVHRLWSGRALKAVVGLPGDAGFAAAGLEGGVRRFSPELDGDEVLATLIARRLVGLGDRLLALRYGGPAGLITPGDPEVALLTEAGSLAWFDAGSNADRSSVAAMDEGGGLWSVPAQGAARRLGDFPDAWAVDATTSGGAVLGEDGALVVVQADGSERRLLQPPGPVVDLALSPDDRLAAVGGLDGVVRVVELASGRTVAVLEGHQERVATLAWASDARLLSGSWDGTVRLWDLSHRDTPAAQLVAEVEAAWGLNVADALAATAP